MEYPKVKRWNFLMNEIEAIYHDAAVRMGISDSVQSILYTICVSGDRCLQSDIYKQIGSSRQTINSAIRKLEKEGVVYLEKGRGRNTVVCLTEKGKAMADEKARPILEAENEIFEEWSPEEFRVYLELTEKYRDAFKQKLRVFADK